jgi:hypothetical protein
MTNGAELLASADSRREILGNRVEPETHIGTLISTFFRKPIGASALKRWIQFTEAIRSCWARTANAIGRFRGRDKLIGAGLADLACCQKSSDHVQNQIIILKQTSALSICVGEESNATLARALTRAGWSANRIDAAVAILNKASIDGCAVSSRGRLKSTDTRA